MAITACDYPWATKSIQRDKIPLLRGFRSKHLYKSLVLWKGSSPLKVSNSEDFLFLWNCPQGFVHSQPWWYQLNRGHCRRRVEMAQSEGSEQIGWVGASQFKYFEKRKAFLPEARNSGGQRHRWGEADEVTVDERSILGALKTHFERHLLRYTRWQSLVDQTLLRYFKSGASQGRNLTVYPLWYNCAEESDMDWLDHPVLPTKMD